MLCGPCNLHSAMRWLANDWTEMAFDTKASQSLPRALWGAGVPSTLSQASGISALACTSCWAAQSLKITQG